MNLKIQTTAIKAAEAAQSAATEAAHVAAKEGETHLTIFVKDTGVGIEEVNLEKIFIPFEQCREHSGVWSDGASVGLGLAIARSLVELHGGTLTVESREGCGSCFTFTIPY